MFSPADPRSNFLLAALIDAGCDSAAYPENVEWRAGQSLYESGETQSHLYFPSNTVVSLQYILNSGASSEFALVGNHGVVGISLVLGSSSMPSRAEVQGTGWGFRIPAQAIQDDFERPGPIRHLLLNCMQILITQTAQSAVCNRHHVVEQQLCRFLLQRLDNLPTNELMITQEQIARLLGVRRESVTQAAAKLHEAGYVRYSRGRIAVLNRQALEQRSCECYAVVKQEFDRFLPQPCVIQQAPMAVMQPRTGCCLPARDFPARVSAA